jgi:hypothetical protein
MISCAEAIRQLWSYLEDEVDSVERQHIGEHIDACRKCCGELEFLTALRQQVANSQLELPADVRGRMEQFLVDLENSRG